MVEVGESRKTPIRGLKLNTTSCRWQVGVAELTSKPPPNADFKHIQSSLNIITSSITESREKNSTDSHTEHENRPLSQNKPLHLPVRVDGLRHDAAVLADVVHRDAGPAAVAALVVGRVASHELLLRQRLKRVSREVPRPLQAACRAEAPAGPAVRLLKTSGAQGRGGGRVNNPDTHVSNAVQNIRDRCMSEDPVLHVKQAAKTTGKPNVPGS